MKKLSLFLGMLTAIAVLATVLVSCSEDDPVPITLTSLTAGSIDLNGATSATEVPVDAVITAVFTTDVDASTATSSTIKLTRDYDDADVAATITVSGKNVTITPQDDLTGGALFELAFLAGIKSTEGETLTGFNRTFSTAGIFVPAGQIAYWNFEDNANDVVGAFDPAPADVVAITYVASRAAKFGKAASFDGDESIIEIPNGDELMDATDFSLSFWVRTNSDGHLNGDGNPAGHFVMGLGAFFGFQFEIPADYKWCKFAVQYLWADGTTGTGGDLFFNGDGKDKDNGGWQGAEERRDLTGAGGVEAYIKDRWVHVVFVYDNTTKRRILYLDGKLMQSENFNLWPEGTKERTASGLKFAANADVGNKLAFGFVKDRSSTLWANEPWGGYTFPGANHFKGLMDDVRVFHSALTETEVDLMYKSERP
jgi:hypothetical protein